MFSALLGRKSKQKSQSGWAVVLDRASDELARKRAAAELRHTFGVSDDEASQLLENTPIILLDQVPHETAVKINDYFSSAKIDCFLTNNQAAKSKCFRAVWPSTLKPESIVKQMSAANEAISEEAPSASSGGSIELNPWKPEDEDGDAVAPPEEQVMSSFVEEGAAAQEVEVEVEEEEKEKKIQEQAQEKVLEQTISGSEHLKDLAAELRKEDEMLQSHVRDAERAEESRNREEINRLLEEGKKLAGENADLNRKVQDLEKMVKLSDLRQIAKSHKQVLESASLREARQQLVSLKEQLEQFRGEHMRSQDLLKEAQTEAGAYENELTQAQRVLREAQAEAAQFQSEWSRVQKELSEARAACGQLKESLDKAGQDAQELRREKHELAGVCEELKSENQSQAAQITGLAQQLDEAERAAQELCSEKDRLEEICKEFKTENRSQAAQITELKKQCDRLSESQKRTLQELEETRLKHAGDLEAIEKTHEDEMKQAVDAVLSRLTERETELEEWKRKAAEWNANYSRLLKESESAQLQQSEELESSKSRNRELAVQLDQAQKQIRNFSFQLEQQELAQKRMRAASDLAHHETQLKSLVQSQRAMETRLAELERELKTVLGEQEAVEREIVKAKQVQKYLMEQSKIKEKTRLLKIKAPGEAATSESAESPETFDSPEKS